MSLRKKQSEFTRAIGLLINYAYKKGYELTLGDTYPGKFKHNPKGFHPKGLAIDLNAFVDDIYLRETESYAVLGEYWESLGGTWGGRWNDGNHFSWGE